jgi:hypothetical protein
VREFYLLLDQQQFSLADANREIERCTPSPELSGPFAADAIRRHVGAIRYRMQHTAAWLSGACIGRLMATFFSNIFMG